MTIGVTDNSKYNSYAHWIAHEPDVEVIRLGYTSDNFHDISRCQGILLTGGDEDIHPRYYHHPEFVSLCTGGLDEKRDEFELKVVNYAMSNRLPVLGICRGLQITNIYFGGSLYPDISSVGKSDHSKFVDGKDRYHQLSIDVSSVLNRIVSVPRSEVNSAHHQSADRIGEGLVANAFSEDGVVEGLERKDAGPYLMLVQWHPERMSDQGSPLVDSIKRSFLKSMR